MPDLSCYISPVVVSFAGITEKSGKILISYQFEMYLAYSLGKAAQALVAIQAEVSIVDEVGPTPPVPLVPPVHIGAQIQMD